MLIVLGIGVFVTITANFLALILRKDDDQLTMVLVELKKLNSLLEANELLHKPGNTGAKGQRQATPPGKGPAEADSKK